MKLKGKVDFKNREWSVYGANAFPIYLDIGAGVPSKGFYKKYGISNDAVVLFKGTEIEWLYDTHQLIKLSEHVLMSLLANPDKFYSDWEFLADKFSELHYETMGLEISSMKLNEIRKLMKQYCRMFHDQYIANNILEPVSMYLQMHLDELLSHTGLSRQKANTLTSYYGTPNKDNYMKKCVKEYKKLKDKNKVDKLLQKYHFMNNDYTGEKPFTKEDLTELVKRGKINLKKKIKRVATKNKEASQLLRLLQTIATMQDVRKEHSLMFVSGIDKFLKEISKRKGISERLLHFALLDEIFTDSLYLDELKNRARGCVIIWDAKKTAIHTKKEYRDTYEDYKKYILKDTSEIKKIKGTVARKGKVKGRAVIVLNVSHFNKVRNGDIIVSMMTRPEYLPIMYRAAAFVTDEGGITCHAAIVARELRKPCIIGTKIATKLLHDGDMIEVDANKGVVKILEKK